MKNKGIRNFIIFVCIILKSEVMKRFYRFLVCAAVAAVAVSCSANQGNVEAQAPDKGKVLAEILKVRKSVREFAADKIVSDEVIMDILWTANGVNREDGKRTAPSAVNAQDIELYVCNEKGVHFYKPQEEVLEQISAEDIRPVFAGRNTTALGNPVILLVSDKSKFPPFGDEPRNRFAAMDAGYVSQNIYLYCAANGMATVACAGGINPADIQEKLSWPETKVALLYHPIGYPVE